MLDVLACFYVLSLLPHSHADVYNFPSSDKHNVLLIKYLSLYNVYRSQNVEAPENTFIHHKCHRVRNPNNSRGLIHSCGLAALLQHIDNFPSHVISRTSTQEPMRI